MAKNQEITKMIQRAKYITRLNQGGVAKKLGVTPQYLSDVINGRAPFNDELRSRLSELCSDTEKTEISPCFDLSSIQGGMASGTGAEQFLPEYKTGSIMVPGIPTDDGTPYIKVCGMSMVNRRDPEHSIPEGAWVGVRPSTSSVIRWGEVYAVMTTDGPIVKKLMPSEREGCVKCVSFNEEDGFLPFDLPVNEIIQPLYTIVGVVTAKKW